MWIISKVLHLQRHPALLCAPLITGVALVMSKMHCRRPVLPLPPFPFQLRILSFKHAEWLGWYFITTALGLYGGVLWSGELQGSIIHALVPAPAAGTARKLLTALSVVGCRACGFGFAHDVLAGHNLDIMHCIALHCIALHTTPQHVAPVAFVGH
jgi:hypothetical protein